MNSASRMTYVSTSVCRMISEIRALPWLCMLRQAMAFWRNISASGSGKPAVMSWSIWFLEALTMLSFMRSSFSRSRKAQVADAQLPAY